MSGAAGLTADYVMQVGKEAIEQILSSLPPDEVLKNYKPEERLIGLKPEERLQGLKPEEIQRYLDSLQK